MSVLTHKKALAFPWSAHGVGVFYFKEAMLYHTIRSSIWEDQKFSKLSPQAKLFYIYSFSNHRCPMSGIYKIAIKTMSFELNVDDCTELLIENIKIGLLAYDFEKNVIWVIGKIKHDKSWTSTQRKKSIIHSLDEFNKCSFMDEVISKYPFALDIVLETDVNKVLKSDRSGIGIVSDSGIGIDCSPTIGYAEGMGTV